jgi:hypothetical protein
MMKALDNLVVYPFHPKELKMFKYAWTQKYNAVCLFKVRNDFTGKIRRKETTRNTWCKREDNIKMDEECRLLGCDTMWPL